MPRKKKLIRLNHSEVKRTSSSRVNLSSLDLGNSYVSLFLGAFVVVIIAVVLFFVINGKRIQSEHLNNIVRENLQQQLNEQVKTDQEVIKPADTIKGNTYTIAPGDDLWTIAVKKYSDGNKWAQIAVLNKISNPDVLIAGDKLDLPDNLGAGSYTVKEGDSLWSIAVNKYGDGYKWVEIAKANNVSNPDWIPAGAVLILP